MSPEWESVVAEIEEKLLTLKAPDLNDVCAALSITVQERDKDLPRKLRRLILQYIEGEDIISLEDGGMFVLLELNDKIDALRELKITGQIGEPNQKDKLTYASLERQIQRALKKGYEEGEVVEAVIQAITPGTKLKSYLESRIDLTLQALRQILRTHYIEKDATELYHSLTRAVQEPKEMPIQFLMRAMDLRQQIILASDRVKSGLKYSAELIQNQFLQTVMTGLYDDTIRTDILTKSQSHR